MIRRTKGDKRYAKQRELRFTDALIRVDEIETVTEARKRLSRQGYDGEYENTEDYFIERKNPR